MRVLLVFLFLSFRIHGVVFGRNEVHAKEVSQDNQDKWLELLKWFRELKSNENVTREEQEDDPGSFGDEVTTESGQESQEEWDELINWQMDETFGDENSDLDLAEDEKPVQGASLAFVFDSTGSMSDELAQVKVGAGKILTALRNHPEAPIYNYIWMPFNDPVIGPLTSTTDHQLFRKRMEEVSVFGGGDCPEKSLSAIKKALEACLPNSYVYVFTDASAKDYRLVDDVLGLVQRKHAKIVFILTGNCSDFNTSNYQVYERIAEASSGQIYSLKREEVKEVLKYVKVALQPDVVSLASFNKPAPDKGKPDELTVVIDESLGQFTVSVSGTNASFDVKDPKGINIDGPPKLEKVLNLNNIKVVNVKQPDPGPWSVLINSDSNYTFRSTGLSKINFKHGFSTVETTNLKETNYRPLKGAKSFVLIESSDSEKIYNITGVDLVDLSGKVLMHLDLEPVPGTTDLYKGGGFVPPSEFFYLGVTGFGQDGLPIKRITSTAVSPQLPEKPIISMRPKLVGRAGTKGSIKCYVQSVVPITVKWFKNGVFLDKEQNCSETCEVILNIEKFGIQSEGKYSCLAKNVAGSDSKAVAVSVLGDAPLVTVNSTVIATLGQSVVLDCVVESQLPYEVKWTQFTATNRHSGILHPSSTGIKLENDSLLIQSVKAEDEGWFVCMAASKGGESEGRILLTIKEPLTVKVDPTVVHFVEKDSVRITCSAAGKPQPALEWLRDQEMLQIGEDPSLVIEEINGNLNLVIDYLEKKHSGVYVCNAINPEELATASVELIYTEKPMVKAKENNVMVKVGSEVILNCTATGYPQPDISWFKGEEELVDNSRFEIKEGILKIESAMSSDAGEYSCVAKNDLGSEEDYIGLIVGTGPSFLQIPKNKRIQVNHHGTIPCSAIGTPPPEIKWKRQEGQNIDPARIFILPNGALRITKMKFEDEGVYVCKAENVFDSIAFEVFVKATGVEKPVPDKNIKLAKVEASSGSELVIPCGITLGNPPGIVKWFKDNVEIQQTERIFVQASGDLLILNATATDRGNYICSSQNALGNSSRSYEVLISESPKIKDTNETGLKGKVGGEIVIPCPVEGFPLPTVVWTKNGLPLPMSSTIFQDENGSLIIRNLTEENTGVYVCTAINAVGSASKTTSIHVQVPPNYPDDIQDSPVNVVEGHVVMLNCNVTGVPEPAITWFKNDEPLLQYDDQPKILRFVANMDDTGVFRCVAENEAGSSTKEFNVSILVPPKIYGRQNEESIKAKAGVPITLLCDVFGVPMPTILWQRNGMYITQNTSDLVISDSGSLIIHNVSKESAGAYTCDAENMAGITQRNYYLQVNYPPKIIEDVNVTKMISLKEGEEYSLTCMVEGNPKPNVIWRKNGFPIQGHQSDLIVLEDNTLVFLQVTRETTGTYKCEAINSEGTAFKEHDITVMIPPSITSDYYPTKLEVNEGDSLSLTCPTSFSIPPPHIQWIKDKEPLDLLLQERSDEAQMKLSFDQRTLTIVEAHPSDKGNYSCVATNLAGRTDARFLVDVLMTPHFEEFNHIAHRTTLTGGEIVLNCSVTGNPQPKVTWRKENTPITPHNTPGVHVSLDKHHLTVLNAKVYHTGTYICMATNKVNTKEREFYIKVVEPPQIEGPLQQMVDVMKGDNVTLYCQGSGVPPPTFTWTKHDDTKRMLSNTEGYLEIVNATCEDNGLYLCDVTNTAGTRTKYFELTVLESPKVENQSTVDEVTATLGSNVTMKCKASGTPKPDITWLHNGHILNKVKKRSIEPLEHDDGWVSLTLTDIQETNRGTYTMLASNKAGVVEKKFNVQILVPPRLLDGHQAGVEILRVVQPFPIILKCPVRGDPMPVILWFYEDQNGDYLKESDEVVLTNVDLRIRKSSTNHSGVYICVAENPGGRLAHYFNVTVIGPPKAQGSKHAILNVLVNNTLMLHCNATGVDHVKHHWFHGSMPLDNSLDIAITNSSYTLIINKIKLSNSGKYSCLTSNVAGSTEVTYQVNVYEPPFLSDRTLIEEQKVVQLHHPFSLYCFFRGYPPPEMTWFKDGKILIPENLENSLFSDNSYLTVSSSKPEHSGDYKCLAQNKVGTQELNFRVDVIVYAEWTPWSDWSECSVSCGFGQQIRRRSCISENDSRLKLNRSKCIGEDYEERGCFGHCQVNSNWSDWGMWSSCSKTCGRGMRKRIRQCNNIEPEQNGLPCEGNSIEEETCSEKNCPQHGQWSEWSEWSSCSDPCGGGVTQRVRKCNSPPPEHEGEDCLGWGSELKICNRNKCREGGRWMPWSDWSPCSETCGKGNHKRTRNCKPFKPGGTCKGENLQMKKCFIRSCYNNTILSSANLFVKGSLNGNPIDDQIDVSFQNSPKGHVSAQMKDFLKKDDKWFPYGQFLLSPLSWNNAYETDNADNGYSLTDGNFFSRSDIQFATGEELRMKHKGDGVDENGTLIVEIEVIGEVPLVEPHSTVIVRPFEQDFVQTSPNTLYAFSQNNVTVAGRDLPFSWNSSIQYDNSRGTMPYLVEKLSMEEIQHNYNRETQNLGYSASSTISKKFDDDHCPSGFFHDPNLMHCEDLNECETSKTLCHGNEVCENTFGSYECVCRRGFEKTENGCLDIDECHRRVHHCSHFCHNTLGSYRCSCPPKFNLSYDLKTCLAPSTLFKAQNYEDVNYDEDSHLPRTNLALREHFYAEDYEELQEYKAVPGIACPPGYFIYKNQCKDYNECEDVPNICDKDETCINFPGSYQCLSIPCPLGYKRMQSKTNCIKKCKPENKCLRGATVSESVIFHALTTTMNDSKDFVFNLTDIMEPLCNAHETRYKVTESNEIFKVQVLHGKGSLHALRRLNKDTLYRVKVEAFSYSQNNDLLYFTEFVIFIANASNT